MSPDNRSVVISAAGSSCTGCCHKASRAR